MYLTFRTFSTSFTNYKIGGNISYLSNSLHIFLPIFHKTLKTLSLRAAFGTIECHYEKSRCSSHGKVLHRSTWYLRSFFKICKKPDRCTVDPAQILSVMVRFPVPSGNHHLFFSVRWNGNTDFRARLSSAQDTFIKSLL